MRLKKSVHLLLSGLIALALVFSAFPPSQQTAYALSPNIVISQVYGGGGNSGATYTHDFIELFNRGTTAASLAGWSLQYASAAGTGNFGSSSTQFTELPAVTLQPGQYFLVQEAPGTGGTTPLPAPDVVDGTPIAMGATGGKVALVNTTTPLGCNGGSAPCSPAALAMIVDLVGYGSANFFEGSGPTPAPSNTTGVSRLNGGCVETDNNAADFTVGAPTPHNTASPFNSCSDPIMSCAPINSLQGIAASGNVSAVDPDGTVIDIQITNISPMPASGSITLSNLVPASSVGGTATATVDVDAGVPAGVYTVNVTATNNDSTPKTGTCALTVTIQAVLPIGTVQGTISDTTNGRTHVSPYNGQIVYIRGVIYQKVLSRTSAGVTNYGFFIQNTAATADSDPQSSDGIFVFMNRFSDLIGGYVPVVGDEVIISGRVSEFFNLSQLSSASLQLLLRSGVDLNAEVPAVEVDPPDDFDEAGRYWERLEGMRARVPAESIVLAGRSVFPSTADGEVWVARSDTTIGERLEPYTNRSFRDPHPLDDLPALFDNNNGYRIIMGSLGLKAAMNDTSALIAPARTFDTMLNSPVGGVYFSFSKYQIQIEQQLDLMAGLDPSANNAPEAFDRGAEYSVTTFNVENLYDYRDDPFDGCDFTGNTGCPGVSPPFDYVPASQAAYDARLYDIAAQVAFDLHAPDIVLAQEVEDQDICTVSSGALVCGSVNDADGKPDPLQELALAISALGGPEYDAAFDRDSADDRGITNAYLFRSDRVELLPASADHPVLGSSPTVDYRGEPLAFNTDVQNPKALNADLPSDVDTSTGTDGSNVFTRAVQVGYFRIWRTGFEGSVFTDVYLLNNHFSSTPTSRVGQRTEQAAYNAAIVNALYGAFEDPRVVVGGDLNVYPRPDDAFFPSSPRYPSDQLGPIYNAGMTNLWDVVVANSPESAYSYNFEGQAQTLDQLFANPALMAELMDADIAHVNADFPAEYDGDGARGTSDHDPTRARLNTLPDLDRLMDLVDYFEDTGYITGNQTERILLKHLMHAQEKLLSGNRVAYLSALQAFIDQVMDFTPQWITPEASAVLIQEAELLRSLPFPALTLGLDRTRPGGE